MIITKKKFESRYNHLEEQLVNLTYSNPKKKWLRNAVSEELQNLKKIKETAVYINNLVLTETNTYLDSKKLTEIENTLNFLNYIVEYDFPEYNKQNMG